MARQYAAALPFVVLAVWHSAWWLAVPAGAAVLRVIKSIWNRRGEAGWRWCLNPAEDLSPGQIDEIDRVYASYPHLNDDEFVRQNLDEWLR